MKRITNGHYADPTSTWSIAGISPEEFDRIKDSVVHLKNKYGIIVKLSDADWKQMMVYSKKKLQQVALDDFAMSDETMTEGRKVLSRDIDITTVLEARIIMLSLSRKTDEMIDLSYDEFRVIVDAVRNYCLDLTNIINSSKEEILNQVRKISGHENAISQEKIINGLDKITTEEHKEKSYQQVRVLYKILEAINQPYEGAKYFDSNGNKIDTTKIPNNTATSIN